MIHESIDNVREISERSIRNYTFCFNTIYAESMVKWSEGMF